jgi:hypothetical protein
MFTQFTANNEPVRYQTDIPLDFCHQEYRFVGVVRTSERLGE